MLHYDLASFIVAGTCTSSPSNSLVIFIWQPSLDLQCETFFFYSTMNNSFVSNVFHFFLPEVSFFFVYSDIWILTYLIDRTPDPAYLILHPSACSEENRNHVSIRSDGKYCKSMSPRTHLKYQQNSWQWRSSRMIQKSILWDYDQWKNWI